jgi:hypothetical protein
MAQSQIPTLIKTTFAVGVLFNYNEASTFIKDFVFSHFSILEYRLNKLVRNLIQYLTSESSELYNFNEVCYHFFFNFLDFSGIFHLKIETKMELIII